MYIYLANKWFRQNIHTMKSILSHFCQFIAISAFFSALPICLFAHIYPSPEGVQVETSLSPYNSVYNGVQVVNISQINRVEHLIYTVTFKDPSKENNKHTVEIVPFPDCPAHLTINIVPSGPQEVPSNRELIFHVFISSDIPGVYIFTEVLFIDGKAPISSDGYEYKVSVSNKGYFFENVLGFVNNEWKYILTAMATMIGFFYKYGQQIREYVYGSFLQKRNHKIVTLPAK